MTRRSASRYSCHFTPFEPEEQFLDFVQLLDPLVSELAAGGPERELWSSVRREILRCAQDDTLEAASFQLRDHPALSS